MHLKIALGHLSSGNQPQALAELLQAEKLDDSNPVIQNNLGLTYFFRDRLELAELHLRNAVDLKPSYSEALNNLGRILIERAKYKEATTEIQKVIDYLTYPTPERAYSNMGLAKFKQSDFEGAKKHFQKSIELQRENCMALTYYGRCFYELKDFKRSAEVLDKAVGFCMKSQYDEPHYYSALSYYQIGQVVKAETRLEELIKLYPDGKYVEKAKTALETMKR